MFLCPHLVLLIADDFVSRRLVRRIAPLYRIADAVEREVNVPCRVAPPAQTLAGSTLTVLTCTHASMILTTCNNEITDTTTAARWKT